LGLLATEVAMRFAAAIGALFFVTSVWAAEPTTKPAGEQPKKMTTPSGLIIESVKPGEGAKDGDTVEVLYTGKLANNGKVFDSSEKQGGRPIQFMLGRSMVIKGWDEG